MSAKSLILLALILFASIEITACKQAVNSSQGFSFETGSNYAFNCTQESPTCVYSPTVPYPGIQVNGFYQYDDTGAAGTVQTFSEYTQGANASFYVSNGRAPAVWNVFSIWPVYCGTSNLYAQEPNWLVPGDTLYEYLNADENIPNLSTTEITCTTYQNVAPASSRFAIVGNLPASISLNSLTPYVTTDGEPLLYVYDQNGNIAAQETASSITSGGSSATFPFPTSLGQGAYGLAVVNQAGSGSIQPASTNYLSIASSQTVTGSPFGVAVGARRRGVYGVVCGGWGFNEQWGGSADWEGGDCQVSEVGPEGLPAYVDADGG